MKAEKFKETIPVGNVARHNLKIIGDNSAGGGYYNNARVVGNSIINGDLNCINFKSVGDSKVNGNLKADNLRIVGTISVSGSTKSDSVVITGNLDATGDVHSQTLILRGGITAEGSIKGEEARLKGYITIKKNCEIERFRADGQLTIYGLLNADEIDIRTYGQSRIAEIGGDKITIRKGSNSSVAKMIKFLFIPSGFHKGMLVADTIEGDEIRLAFTKAKVVRGKNVVIEDGCEVDLVEYEEDIQVHRGARVGERKRSR